MYVIKQWHHTMCLQMIQNGQVKWKLAIKKQEFLEEVKIIFSQVYKLSFESNALSSKDDFCFHLLFFLVCNMYTPGYEIRELYWNQVVHLSLGLAPWGLQKGYMSLIISVQSDTPSVLLVLWLWLSDKHLEVFCAFLSNHSIKVVNILFSFLLLVQHNFFSFLISYNI